MPQFSYKAKREDGSVYEGLMQETDRFGVYAALRKEGSTILSVSEARTNAFSFKALSGMFSGVKERDKIVLMRNLAAMIKAGLSLSRALAVLERQSRSARLKAVLASIRSDIEHGESLKSAMEKFPRIFSALVVAMVGVGEESGSLAETCATVARQLDKADALRKKIRGALIYPSIIVAALILIGVLMLTFVVPTLTTTFEELNVELPASTQLVVSTSTFLTEHTLLGALLGALIVLLGMWFLRSPQGKRLFGEVLLRLPLIRHIVVEANAARTARTLSSLLGAGVSIVFALENTREVMQHSAYRAVLTEAKERLQKGDGLAEVFAGHERLYPPLLAELIAVGEETGNLTGMLNEVATFYESEVEEQTKNISTVIEPFLMLVVGAVVGFFALSMITPIYSVTTTI